MTTLWSFIQLIFLHVNVFSVGTVKLKILSTQKQANTHNRQMKKFRPKHLLCKKCGAENANFDVVSSPMDIVYGCFECWYCKYINLIDIGRVEDYNVCNLLEKNK